MTRHRALIVEDDAELAAELAELVATIDHDAVCAHTLEEATAALADGPYCYALVDVEIPAKAGARPRESSGETVIAKLRASDARHTADGHDVFPILVVTAHWKDPVFITRLVELRPTSFIGKPVVPAHLLDRVKLWLARAGREDHGACGGARPKKARPGATWTLDLDGTSRSQNTSVRVNGREGFVQDEQFVFLLRLAARRAQDEEAYWSHADLGVGSRHAMPSRARASLDRIVAGAGAVIQVERGKGFRIRPDVALEPLEWSRLEKHPHPQVQRIAMEAGRRDRRGRSGGDRGA